MIEKELLEEQKGWSQNKVKYGAPSHSPHHMTVLQTQQNLPCTYYNRSNQIYLDCHLQNYFQIDNTFTMTQSNMHEIMQYFQDQHII